MCVVLCCLYLSFFLSLTSAIFLSLSTSVVFFPAYNIVILHPFSHSTHLSAFLLSLSVPLLLQQHVNNYHCYSVTHVTTATDVPS
jgi:hypothetical protein